MLNKILEDLKKDDYSEIVETDDDFDHVPIFSHGDLKEVKNVKQPFVVDSPFKTDSLLSMEDEDLPKFSFEKYIKTKEPIQNDHNKSPPIHGLTDSSPIRLSYMKPHGIQKPVKKNNQNTNNKPPIVTLTNETKKESPEVTKTVPKSFNFSTQRRKRRSPTLDITRSLPNHKTLSRRIFNGSSGLTMYKSKKTVQVPFKFNCEERAKIRKEIKDPKKK